MEIKNTLVSVIVPVYRTERYLAQCVDSLLAQTHSNLEIILVDDESPDRCPQICDAYAARHENIRVIHKQNEGAAFARKTGLAAAAGDYVLFLDGDDWIDCDTVDQCLKTALRDNADCVMFGYVREYSAKSIPTPLFPHAFSYDRIQSEERVHRRLVGLKGEELREPQKVDNLVSFCMRLMRAEAARKGRFVSERETGTSEDTIFNLYALDGCRISYIDRCFYHYRRSDAQSITMAYKPDLADKWDTLYDLFQAYIAGSGRAQEYRTPFLNRVACCMIGLGLNEACSSESIWKKAKKLRRILSKPLYRQAFEQLDTAWFDAKWKLFFLLCRKRAALPLAVLLEIMNYLRSRVAA